MPMLSSYFEEEEEFFFFFFIIKINLLEAWIDDWICISVLVTSNPQCLLSVQAFTFQNHGFLCLIDKIGN